MNRWPFSRSCGTSTSIAIYSWSMRPSNCTMFLRSIGSRDFLTSEVGLSPSAPRAARRSHRDRARSPRFGRKRGSRVQPAPGSHESEIRHRGRLRGGSASLRRSRDCSPAADWRHSQEDRRSVLGRPLPPLAIANNKRNAPAVAKYLTKNCRKGTRTQETRPDGADGGGRRRERRRRPARGLVRPPELTEGSV